MGKLNRLPARKVIQKLHRAGFEETHRRGSHIYFKSSDSKRLVGVPAHGSKDIPVGTLYNIVVRQAGLSINDFNSL